MEEIAFHNREEDCWIILHDDVIDVTHFMKEHPGGMKPLLKYAGRDCTASFLHVHHSKRAIALMQPFIIGKIKRI